MNLNVLDYYSSNNINQTYMPTYSSFGMNSAWNLNSIFNTSNNLGSFNQNITFNNNSNPLFSLLLSKLLKILGGNNSIYNAMEEDEKTCTNSCPSLYSSNKITPNLNLNKETVTKQTIIENLTKKFNENEYLANNPDVAKAVREGYFSSGYEHYLQHGISEGRTININNPAETNLAAFSEQAYLEANPDVAKAVAAGQFTSGFDHYSKHGAGEGRSGLGDVKTTTIVTTTTNSGSTESSSSSVTANTAGVYNEAAYLAANPDVAAAVAAGAFTSGLDHYSNHGALEGRSPS